MGPKDKDMKDITSNLKMKRKQLKYSRAYEIMHILPNSQRHANQNNGILFLDHEFNKIMKVLIIEAEGRRRWRKSKTRRSPSFPQIH